jgi:hypothetical protein
LSKPMSTHEAEQKVDAAKTALASAKKAEVSNGMIQKMERNLKNAEATLAAVKKAFAESKKAAKKK